jgi:predicted nucleic acid-binding protein
MAVLIFVDTNDFIYAVDQGDEKKHELARAWRTELWKSRRGRTSFQVLQEFYGKVTAKWPDARQNARPTGRSARSAALASHFC